MAHYYDEETFRMWGECDICGERYDNDSPSPSISEFAEFWNPKTEEGGIIAHGECGLGAGYELA